MLLQNAEKYQLILIFLPPKTRNPFSYILDFEVDLGYTMVLGSPERHEMYLPIVHGQRG